MVEKIPLEGGGFAVDPVELINAADNAICSKIADLFSGSVEPITMLSTLSRVIGWVIANGAPDFASVEDGAKLVQFMILTNAKIAWDQQHKEEGTDGNRVH